MNNKIKICQQAGQKFHGYTMPKNALYGMDEHGIFICIDFRIKSMRCIAKAHKIRKWDEYGQLHEIELSPAKYVPVMRILRPEKHGINDEKKYTAAWKSRCECNATASAILDLVDRYELEPDWGTKKVRKIVVENNELVCKTVNAVSCRDAKALTAGMNQINEKWGGEKIRCGKCR